uniref:Cse1 domain-containing protein n=1 Tax=Gongylonema pulchrum TaxID=637853 RepID=A0A183D635_9BILA
LQNLCEAWWVILRNSEDINDLGNFSIDFKQSTVGFVTAFVRTIPVRECDEMNDEDDREVFGQILDSVGRFASNYVYETLPLILR